MPSARRSRSQVNPCATARIASWPDAFVPAAGRRAGGPRRRLQLAFEQPRAADRIAGPGIANGQRGRVGDAAHAQAGQRAPSPGAHRAASAGSGVIAPASAAIAGWQPAVVSGAPNTAVPATSMSAPASTRAEAVPGVMPPSTSSAIGRPPIVDHAAQGAILGSCEFEERLPAEARIDGHHQHHVDAVEHGFDGLGRGRRVEHDARPLAERADELQRAVQMRPGLGMDDDVVGAGLGESRDVRVGRAIIRCTSNGSRGAGASAFSTGGPNEMFGTKCPSMMSRCSQSAPAASTLRDLLAEAGEVGGEQAGATTSTPRGGQAWSGLDRPIRVRTSCSGR